MNSPDPGLLHLVSAWRDGAVILAGLGVSPKDPVPTGPRLGMDCTEPRCHVTAVGATDIELADRLAEHRRRCHG